MRELIEMARKETYIQVGVTALRDPKTGDFLPAVPLYILADEEAEASEAKLIDNIGGILARRYKEYLDGCKQAGVAL